VLELEPCASFFGCTRTRTVAVSTSPVEEKELFIDNLLVRIHVDIEIIPVEGEGYVASELTTSQAL